MVLASHLSAALPVGSAAEVHALVAVAVGDLLAIVDFTSSVETHRSPDHFVGNNHPFLRLTPRILAHSSQVVPIVSPYLVVKNLGNILVICLVGQGDGGIVGLELLHHFVVLFGFIEGAGHHLLLLGLKLLEVLIGSESIVLLLVLLRNHVG